MKSSESQRGTRELAEGWGKTPWTLLLQAASQQQAQLERLLSIYQGPVYAYYRAQKLPRADAEDLAQHLLLDFFLVRESHKNAHPARGKFRNYLQSAARHALLDWKKHGRTQRRGGRKPKISLDSLRDDGIDWEPSSQLTPDEEFDRKWALATWRAADELFAARSGAQSVAAFRLFYCGKQRLSQQAAAQQLGISVAALNSRLYTARRAFFACIKEIVKATVEDETELESEIKTLQELLTRTGSF